MTAAERHGARGFTVIELMVVTLIIAILMSIAFKISGIGDQGDRRTRTIERIQKLENCLSGYYAVYGMYPPVPLQGVSRNIDVKVNMYGVQGQGNSESGESGLDWERVKAACLAQPVGVKYPYPEAMNDVIESLSKLMEERYKDSDNEHIARKFSRGFENASVNPGKFGSEKVSTGDSTYKGKSKQYSPNWNDCQLFRYGLMSFLLPRYLFMMGGAKTFYEGRSMHDTKGFTQWQAFNSIPANIKNGKHFDNDGPSTFAEMRNLLNYDGTTGEIRASRENLAKVETIPSQSVCRRWLANLEGIVSGGLTFYGINTRDKDGYNQLQVSNTDIALYEAHGQQYVLGEMTVCDGWGRTLYYYSAPPYQSYRLWSAGANGKTFPPWVELNSLDSSDRKKAVQWMGDDIIMMSN